MEGLRKKGTKRRVMWCNKSHHMFMSCAGYVLHNILQAHGMDGVFLPLLSFGMPLLVPNSQYALVLCQTFSISRSFLIQGDG